MINQLAFYSAFLLLFCACGEELAPISVDNTADTESITENEKVEQNDSRTLIESAHNKTGFLSHQAVAFDIILNFGGKERLRGTQILATDGSAGMLIKANGDTVIYKGATVACSPSVNKPENARFGAYTWSYFFLFPHKLSDGGTIWNEQPNNFLKPKEYAANKLTFESGTGDDPNDWYIAYRDRESNLIQLAAYIVTSGGTVEEAEEDPHAIEYLNYNTIDGVPFAEQWIFHEWREGKGLTGELGNATISNIHFEENWSFDIPTAFVISN